MHVHMHMCHLPQPHTVMYAHTLHVMYSLTSDTWFGVHNVYMSKLLGDTINDDKVLGDVINVYKARFRLGECVEAMDNGLWLCAMATLN